MLELKTKICTYCLINKPLSEFDKNGRQNTGLRSRCKSCCNLFARKLYAKGGEYRKNKALNASKYYSSNREKVIESYYKNKLRSKNNSLKSKYGINLEDYDKMLVAQNYTCKTCPQTHSDQEYGLYVDHDHITGKVRGLLCRTCNLALGYVKDSPVLLKSLIDYLKEHGIC